MCGFGYLSLGITEGLRALYSQGMYDLDRPCEVHIGGHMIEYMLVVLLAGITNVVSGLNTPEEPILIQADQVKIVHIEEKL